MDGLRQKHYDQNFLKKYEIMDTALNTNGAK